MRAIILFQHQTEAPSSAHYFKNMFADFLSRFPRLACTVYVIIGQNDLIVKLTMRSFVAKLGRMAEDKFHVIVPKQYNEKIKHLKGKQVKLVLDDEL